MNRRQFIKWLGAAIIVGACGALGLRFRDKESALMTPPAAPAATDGFIDGVMPAVQDPDVTPAAQDSSEATGAITPFAFFILSDLHVRFDQPAPSEHLRKAFADITGGDFDPKFLLFGGDLTEFGRSQDYKELRAIMKEFKLPPVYANMGNHDYYPVWIDRSGAYVNGDAMPNGRTDAGSRKAFMDFFGYKNVYQDFAANGCQFLLMSQEAYIQEKPQVGEGAWYSDAQLAWLKQKLEERGKDGLTFILIHQPLPPKGQDGGSHQLIRAKEFRNILAPYRNVFVVSGHNHRDFEFVKDHYFKETFHWLPNSSVGRVLDRSFKQVKKDAAQGLYVQVFPNRVVLKAREFSDRTWMQGAEWTIDLV